MSLISSLDFSGSRLDCSRACLHGGTLVGFSSTFTFEDVSLTVEGGLSLAGLPLVFDDGAWPLPVFLGAGGSAFDGLPLEASILANASLCSPST